MNNQEYERKKRECWEEYVNLLNHNSAARYVFDKIFGRAYALGKQEKEAEGEEMLYVSRKKVQELYNRYFGNPLEPVSKIRLRKDFKDLFGSKRLPDEKEIAENANCSEPITQFKFKIGDKVRVKGIKQIGTIKEPYSNDIGYRVYFEDGDGGWDREFQEDELIPYKEPKSDEPKFKVSDTASYVCSPTLKHKCIVTKVMQNEHSGKWEYNVMFEWGKPGMWIPESDLEPYTEPEENVNLSQSSSIFDKQFDNILKDSFRGHNRLHIATQMASAYISSEGMTDPSLIATIAFQLADALIAESEKGGN